MNYYFRKAALTEVPKIWTILQQAIARRRQDGSEQWQDGYPNEEVVQKDIESGAGYVLTYDNVIVGYSAILFNDEPAYANIQGAWLSNEDFVVVHRVAISNEYIGKGLAVKIFEFIEDLALQNNIYSIKADTNFDNIAMLKTFERLCYTYCGEVILRGGVRKAFEKVLTKNEMVD